MRDRRLERQVEALDDFLERWQRFGDCLRRGSGRKAAEAEDAEFLRLKGDLAQDHESLMEEIGGETDPDDRTVMLLGAATSMKRLGELNDKEARILEGEWHTTYICLQRVLGRLKARKLQLASVSAVGYYIGCVVRNPLFILLLLGAVVSGVLWLWNFTQPSSDNTIERRGARPTLPEISSNP